MLLSCAVVAVHVTGSCVVCAFTSPSLLQLLHGRRFSCRCRCDVARLLFAGTSRVAVGATGCCTRACPYRECGERAVGEKSVLCAVWRSSLCLLGCAVRMETKNCELYIFHSNSFTDELFKWICWVWDHPSSNRGCVRDELLEPRFIIYYLFCHYLVLIVINFIFVQIGAMSQLRFADLDYFLLFEFVRSKYC